MQDVTAAHPAEAAEGEREALSLLFSSKVN